MRKGALGVVIGMLTVFGSTTFPAHAHDAAHDVAGTPSGFEARADALVHSASGMAFPRVLGSAVLVGESTYDAAGDYVSLHYRIPLSDGSLAKVQIGIIGLPGMTARQHYDSRRPLTLSKAPGAIVIEEAPLPGIEFDNFCGRFTNGNKVEGLVTAQFGDWGVRAETEYSRAVADEAHAAIAVFLAELNWDALRPAGEQDTDVSDPKI